MTVTDGIFVVVAWERLGRLVSLTKVGGNLELELELFGIRIEMGV